MEYREMKIKIYIRIEDAYDYLPKQPPTKSCGRRPPSEFTLVVILPVILVTVLSQIKLKAHGNTIQAHS